MSRGIGLHFSDRPPLRIGRLALGWLSACRSGSIYQKSRAGRDVRFAAAGADGVKISRVA